tara:strand:- start:4149 stop:5558 length:1410 start_codon:yes stop_codon:yes gene_type:complete
MIDQEQFYETPNYLAFRMAKLLPKDVSYLLEPSAGEGALLKAAEDQGLRAFHFNWCEINEVRKKTCERISRFGFLGEDFLNVELTKSYDAVIMNPPFNKAEDHFFKAYEALKAGGTMICLVSEATLDGKSKKESLMLSIIEKEDATIETIEGAFAQKDCKRKSDVTCKLIHFVKDGENSEFEFNDSMKDTVKNDLSLFDQTEQANIARYDYLATMVDNYERTKEEYFKAAKALDKLYAVSPIKIDEIPRITGHDSFVAALRSKCWEDVFKKSKLANYLTSDERKKFHEAQKEQNVKEFSLANIENLLLNMMNSIDDICVRSAKTLFERMTKYHKGNVTHTEGWKSNSCYKISRKIILPDVLSYPWRAGEIPDDIQYNERERLCDIEKTLCMILGIKYEEISTLHTSTVQRALGRLNSESFGVWHDSYFFKIKVFKKRTMHLYFKDEEILNKLNLIGSGSAMNLGGSVEN